MLRQSPVKRKRGKLNIERRFLPANPKQTVASEEMPAETPLPQTAAIIDPSDNAGLTTVNSNVAETFDSVATIVDSSAPSVKTTTNSPTTPMSFAPQIATQQLSHKKQSAPPTPSNLQQPAKPLPAQVAKNNNTQNNVTKIPKTKPDISNNGIATAMPDSDWRIGQYRLPDILAFLVKSSEVNDGIEDESAENCGGGIFTLLNDGLRKAREFDDKLFVSIFETAIRASCKKDNNGLTRETFAQLQQIDGFDECYKAAVSANENWLQLSDRKFWRESRLAADLPLLMFPRVGVGGNNGGGVGDNMLLSRSVGCDYFVMFKGNGTAINPSRDFWNGLCQIGGVVGDVRNIVITGREKIDWNFIEQLKFDRQRQINLKLCEISEITSDLPPLQFFVPNELLSELSYIPNTATMGIESIAADGNEIKLSSGVKLSFQLDQLSLSLMTCGGVRQIRFVGQSGFLCDYSDGDILVFSVDGLEGFLSAVGFSKIAGAALVIFDIPQQSAGLIRLIDKVRKYIGASAVAGSNLVCNVDTECFLDVVKGFDSDKDVWSPYSEIDNCDDASYYFANDAKERFLDEKADITETFLTNRRRRRGLYFK
ncbi:MAG: hypothetical protein LBJ00_07740 [Planctomycetaceae bacterium]|jgi:hypothetical protein|nr:hypothetical protein [Planctomycetaceae bacterium]